MLLLSWKKMYFMVFICASDNVNENIVSFLCDNEHFFSYNNQNRSKTQHRFNGKSLNISV